MGEEAQDSPQVDLTGPVLDVQTEALDGGTRIKLHGELDVATAPQLSEVVESSEGRIDLDLSRLTFIDSTGIRALMTIHRSHEEKGFVIRQGSEQVMRTIGLVGLTDVLPFEDTPGD